MTATLEKPWVLSKKQLSLFWRLFARAWSRHAYYANTPHTDLVAKEAWRHELLQEHGETASIKTLAPEGFESVMLYLAQEANDAGEIGYWTSCVERRYRHLIQEALADISTLTNRHLDWRYARAIHKQSHLLPMDINEVPAETLRQIYQMLDSYKRRLQR